MSIMAPYAGHAERLTELLTNAHNGDSGAMYALSIALLDKAQRPSEDAATFKADAFGWAYIAARGGHADSMVLVAHHFLHSDHPELQAHKAEIWLHRAVEAGAANAYFYLAELYADANLPTFDEDAAATAFQRAQHFQEPRACALLAAYAKPNHQNNSNIENSELIKIIECALQPSAGYQPDQELIGWLTELYDGLGTLEGQIKAGYWRDHIASPLEH